MTLIPSALSANFNEPQSNDPTSAPPVQIPQQQPAQQGLAQALAQRKRKKGLVGPTIKKPSSLAAAISKAKRARQGGDKYG